MTTQFGPEAGGLQAIRSDGAILVATGKTLNLFTPSGVLESAFGQDGQVELPSELEGLPFGWSSYSFDSQGRILIFGVVVDPNQKYVDQTALRSFEATWAVVMRLLPNGGLDLSFGEGKGFVRSDFALRTTVYPREVGASSDPNIPTTSIGAGLADSQDRPVFVAEAQAPVEGRCFYGKGFMWSYPKAVVRLTNSGGLDSTFGGGDGIADISGGERGASLQLDGADGLVVATSKESCEDRDNVFRFGADGLPVATFGTSGVRLYSGLAFRAIGPGGKLTLGGSSVRVGKRTRPAIFRTLPSGERDPTFGKGGKAAVEVPAGAERWWTTVDVDSSGRTVLVGTFDLPKPTQKRTAHGKSPTNSEKRRPPRSYLFVKRLLPSGKIDRTIGRQGSIITQFKRPRHLRISGAELDDQGRLVVLVGSTHARQLPGAHLTIARYTLDG